jgi:DNA-binding IscR family transcriptional regulator
MSQKAKYALRALITLSKAETGRALCAADIAESQ